MLQTQDEQPMTAAAEMRTALGFRDCRRCGACCRNLVVEAEILDVLREPAIAERCRRLDGRGKLPPDEWTWLLACARPCPFLSADNCCDIYPTRPNVCVGFEPGSDQCTLARAGDHLPPLADGGDEAEAPQLGGTP